MKVIWDTAAFDGMVKDLSRMSGKDHETVLKNRVAKVLENCIRYTPVASIDEIEKDAAKQASNAEKYFKEGQRIIAVNKKNGRTWFSETAGKPWYLMDGEIDGHKWRFSNSRFNRFLQMQQKSREGFKKIKKKLFDAKKKARGLTKKSWLEIAQDIGLSIAVSSYIARANASNGRVYKNGQGRIVVTASQAFIQIANFYPKLTGFLDGQGILQRAINAQVKAFNIDIEKGVLNDVKQRAKRYKGIFVS